MRLWDPGTGAVAGLLTGHTDWVRAVAFSPDGRRLASAGADGAARDPETGTAIQALATGQLIYGLSWTGHQIAVGGSGGVHLQRVCRRR